MTWSTRNQGFQRLLRKVSGLLLNTNFMQSCIEIVRLKPLLLRKIILCSLIENWYIEDMLHELTPSRTSQPHNFFLDGKFPHIYLYLGGSEETFLRSSQIRWI